jgi:ankyrin repeat protein
VVTLLLNAGANIEKGNNDGTTVYKGHTDVVKLLLDAGANKNKANNHGYTPLSVATQKNHQQIMAFLK